MAMIYLMLLGVALFPAVVSISFEAVAFRSFWIQGVSLTRLLASYGIYTIFIMATAIEDVVEEFMYSECEMDESGELPCPLWMYDVSQFLMDWLYASFIGLAIVSQLAYLHFVSRSISFNK